MKKFQKILFGFACVCIMALGLSGRVNADANFTIENGVLKGYSGSDTVITIPNSVTTIGENAFNNCDSLTSITIPNSVTSIEAYAFIGCDGLTSITIPNSVTSIGHAAFEECSNLKSITIPNSVTSIGDDAFYGCSSLTSIAIPNSVTSIGGRTFEECSNLASIIIPNSVTSIGDDAFLRSGLKSITIPNSVTSIGWGAFNSCSNLTSVTIPNSVTSIGMFAFTGCERLKNVTISRISSYDEFRQYEINLTIADGVTSIDRYAFTEGKLTSVTIPNSVTSIGEGAFQYCSSLTSVTIPNSVTSIGSLAFFSCSGLTSITIPNSVKSIGGQAFSWCSGLTSITIPDSVTNIEYGAFLGCDGLTSVTIPKSVTSIGEGAFSARKCENIFVSGENKKYKSIDGVLFDKGEKTIVAFPAGRRGTYRIPESVMSIGGSAFSLCSGLTSITIPNGVKSIGDEAFSYCDSLTSITIPNSVTSIGSLAFSGCSGLTSITIPKSVKRIGECAFDCDSLKDIYFGGTKNQWKAISGIADALGEDCHPTIHYNSGSGVSNKRTATKIKLSKTSLKLNYNSKPYQLTLKTLTPSTASVTWSSDKPNIASVDQKGVVTPHKGGKAKLTATVLNTKVKATCTVTVTGPQQPKSVKINKVKNPIKNGQTIKLTANISPKSGVPEEYKKITWSLAKGNKGHATINSLTGELTCTGAGDIKVQAMTVNKKKATLTIRGPKQVTSVKIKPSSKSVKVSKLKVGDKFTLKPTIKPGNAIDHSVSWSTSNEKVATVDDYGNVKCVGKGKVTITATSKSNKSKSGKCKLTVK